MSRLEVSDVDVPNLLSRLRNNEWLVPEFQREFIWSVSQVIELVNSIIDCRPIGMVTLWEQPDEPEIRLEPLSVRDYDTEQKKHISIYYTKNKDHRPNRVCAILDGRQRSTSLAMAFGGFKPSKGYSKYWGRYFLNVTAKQDNERVIFLREREVKNRKLEYDRNCINQGLFPLASNIEGEDLLQQWVRYLQAIKDPQNYEEGQFPHPEELARRNEILTKTFNGIVNTKLAVYIVDKSYNLPTICDIFEMLNTTGTKVSVVDLIHSLLYSDTAGQQQPILLRDWIDKLGDMNGAVGWSSSENRPELIAQMATACYVASDIKPATKAVSGRKKVNITSVKSLDLLATPVEHWQKIIDHDTVLAGFLGDFQKLVADGHLFPMDWCPYPITSGIYVALRWHLEFDKPSWSVENLNSVFKAFFWKNALANRYDQGFLTKLGSDLKDIKNWLSARAKYTSVTAWAEEVNQEMNKSLGIRDSLSDDVSDDIAKGKLVGAKQKTYNLFLVSRVREDFHSTAQLSYPATSLSDWGLHEIYPKKWCREISTISQADFFNPEKMELDWISSIANLMPMSRQTNNEWRNTSPQAFFRSKAISYATIEKNLRDAFIDEKLFSQLNEGPEAVKYFWERRAQLIAASIIDQSKVQV